jgi:DNA (cytosine-5)-methyltransferase 1
MSLASNASRATKPVSAVDLFCGIGGMTHGLKLSGIKVNAGIDIDETCKYAYERNNHAQFITRDIRNLTDAELTGLYPANDFKLLVGCAPCQPFSSHTHKYKKGVDDEKWGLLTNMQKLIERIKPEIVSVENVPLIRRQKVFTDFVFRLRQLDYRISSEVVFCPDYGVPQTRRRLVLLASLLGEISLCAETHPDSNSHQTVRQTIAGLEKIDQGQRSRVDPLHRASGLSEINQRRIRFSTPGGTWLDWDPDLRAQCHRRLSGQTYKSVYARMTWDSPAPTITTQFYNFGTGRFGHPEQDRALSLREGALLQTFPKDYQLIDPERPFSFVRLGTHIGNAVPVRLATAIGRSIKVHVEKIGHG